MKKLILEPVGWECKLIECPAGLFVFDGNVGFKTEYQTDNVNMEVFCESGEVFIGGSNSQQEREDLLVQPVIAKWEEYEEF